MQADGHQLAAVVPFVGGLCHVEALETLQPHQHRTFGLRQRVGQRGFADTGIAFK